MSSTRIQVVYRKLQESYWQVSGGSLQRLSLLNGYNTTFYVINPVTLNSLGYNKGSVLPSNTVSTNFRFDFTTDVTLSTATNYLQSAWNSNGWNTNSVDAFAGDVANFVYNNFDLNATTPTLNMALWDMEVAILFGTINGSNYAVPMVYHGKPSITSTYSVKSYAPPNYWGTGADGALSTSGNVSLSSTTDGDMVVMNYTNLTVNAGHTLTTANRCKGLLIYVNGDCTINGTISMSQRGANVDPVAAGVSAGGLQFARNTASGSASTSSVLSGAGSAAIAAEANQVATYSKATVFAIQRSGAAGAATHGTPPYPGNNGSNGTTGQSGGGGGGAGWFGLNASAGSDGTCFSGGSGGGAMGGNGGANGGAGGYGANGGAHIVGGGAGNPSAPSQAGCASTNYCFSTCNDCGSIFYAAQEGTGGTLILMVKGTLTIGATGSIVSNGSYGGGSPAAQANQDGFGGGGSGGGNVLVLYGGNLNNSGVIQAVGGAYGPGAYSNGGSGGNGSVQIAQINQ